MTSARNQRTFDIVATKLAQQGRPSARARGFGSPRCMYLAPNGDRCAAGQLFEMPDAAIRTLANVAVEESSEIQEHLGELGHDPAFANELQGAHDKAASHSLEPVVWLAEWASNMRRIAAQHELSTDVLEQALAKRVAAATAEVVS